MSLSRRFKNEQQPTRKVRDAGNRTPSVALRGLVIHPSKTQKMTIKEAMAQANNQPGSTGTGSTGIFYNPRKPYIVADAVFAEHGQEPEGYLIWCDCSKVVRAIEVYGSVDAAFELLARLDA